MIILVADVSNDQIHSSLPLSGQSNTTLPMDPFNGQYVNRFQRFWRRSSRTLHYSLFLLSLSRFRRNHASPKLWWLVSYFILRTFTFFDLLRRLINLDFCFLCLIFTCQGFCFFNTLCSSYSSRIRAYLPRGT